MTAVLAFLGKHHRVSRKRPKWQRYVSSHSAPDIRPPKSVCVDKRQKARPGDSGFFLKKKRGQHCFELPQADLGRAVANTRCHARTRPVEKGGGALSRLHARVQRCASCLALPSSFCLSLLSEQFSQRDPCATKPLTQRVGRCKKKKSQCPLQCSECDMPSAAAFKMWPHLQLSSQ